MRRIGGSRVLHVANGTSTTRLIEAAGLPGIVSIWADPLHEGPVPAGLSDGELTEVRARYLAGESASPHAVNDLREWRATIDRHETYDELILWYEHDLFDQLNLIQVLSWIRSRVPSEKVVSLVSIGTFPGRPQFKGLGELTTSEVASLLPQRQHVTDAQYALAERAWLAFRQPTPEPLDHLRTEDTGALPFLAPTLTRFLQEYPWTGDGLSRSGRRLLAMASDGPTLLRTALPRMHQGEQAYYITDVSLSALADELSASAPPLLIRSPVQTEHSNRLEVTIRLTDAGRSVLVGGHDRIAVCGIDRWFGGVHLQGHADVWRWDNEGKAVVLPHRI